jgi:hypothetical protein
MVCLIFLLGHIVLVTELMARLGTYIQLHAHAHIHTWVTYVGK